MEKEHEHKNTGKSVFSYILIRYMYELQINILDEEIKTIASAMTFRNQSLKIAFLKKKVLKKRLYSKIYKYKDYLMEK